MNRLSILLIASLLLFITGCKHGPSRLARTMDSWVGDPVESLVASWGAPDSSMQLGDGRSVLTWKQEYWRGQYRHECRKSFTIGTDGRVERWSYNDC